MTFLLFFSAYFAGISAGLSFTKHFNSSEREFTGTLCAVASLIISIAGFLLIH